MDEFQIDECSRFLSSELNVRELEKFMCLGSPKPNRCVGILGQRQQLPPFKGNRDRKDFSCPLKIWCGNCVRPHQLELNYCANPRDIHCMWIDLKDDGGKDIQMYDSLVGWIHERKRKRGSANDSA